MQAKTAKDLPPPRPRVQKVIGHQTPTNLTCMNGVRMATPPTCFFAAAELYNDAIPMIETRVPGDTLSTRFRSRTTMMLRGISPVGTTSGLSCSARYDTMRAKARRRRGQVRRGWVSKDASCKSLLHLMAGGYACVSWHRGQCDHEKAKRLMLQQYMLYCSASVPPSTRPLSRHARCKKKHLHSTNTPVA